MNRSGAPARVGSFADLTFLLRRAAPPVWPLAAAAALLLVEVGGTLLFPLLTRDVVDKLGRGTPGVGLLQDTTVVRLLAVLVVAAAAAALSRYLTARSGLVMAARMKIMAFERLIAAPVHYFDGVASGDPTSRIINDTKAVAQLVSRESLSAGAASLLLGGVAVVLFSMDAPLAGILFGVIGAAFLAMLPVLVTVAAVTSAVQDTTARLSGRLTQVFAEIRMVKTFGAEARERRSAVEEIDALFELGRRTARIESALSPVTTLAVTVSLVTILGYGGMRVAGGTLSSGTLMAFLLYIFTVVGPLAQLATFFSLLSAARGASFRLAEVVRAPVEETATAAAAPPALGRTGPRRLAFEGVRFGYGSAGRTALTVDALVLEPGSRTAVIGPSGSGKSTLLSLVERFYTPDAGTIRYGADDIAAVPLAEWRSRIGYVAQTSAMLAGTIRENLLYGIDRPVGEQEIERALSLSRCTGFVSQLPDGLETQVGERGACLSGGERQRIAIARMFLRDPEILLLDEATSSLDEENAHLVLQGLDALMRNRTSVLVTHRLTGLEAMDQVVMVEAGRVVEAGPPHVLFAGSDGYRRIVQRCFARELEA